MRETALVSDMLNLLNLFNREVVDHIADTGVADRIRIERERVVAAEGGIGRDFEFEFPMLPAVFGGKIDAAAFTEHDVILFAFCIHIFKVAESGRRDILIGSECTGKLDVKRRLVLHTGLIGNVLMNVCPNLAFCRSDLPNIALVGVFVDLNGSIAFFTEEIVCIAGVLSIAIDDQKPLSEFFFLALLGFFNLGFVFLC